MSPIFTFILVTLAVLAIFDIIVGVANDAVNFLNSAIGARIAPRRIILGIAAVGIFVGAVTSSGMMEVARSGVFYPAQFSFPEIMMLFLGMLVGDIILLDIFNTLGLPTSTTVSMVFGLLGAAVAVALYKIANNSAYTLADISQFINSGKAMVIISAILLSVVLSIFFGMIFMWLSRLIFSFRYNSMFKSFGALWCGISFTGIIYFSLFKGLKSSGLISPEITGFINDNVALSLLVIWLGASAVLGVLQLCKVNILRITILTGTFALALAFAGNDLVNFIGVPLAGYDSYKLAEAAGSESIMMGDLMNPAKANFLMLAIAGVVMVLTLFFSKKAMKVTETELSLSDQNSGNEKFGSSRFSRGVVRGALIVNSWFCRVTPQPVLNFIAKRFEPLSSAERTDATYDLIRATVNLTAASILISIATSLKLPLSTTYVVFMVAMGSSLADKAWGRESAVYRITGVVTVISGWFITAFAAFTMAAIITSILIWGGTVAVICVVVACVAILVKSNFFPAKEMATDQLKSAEEEKLLPTDSREETLYKCTEEVIVIMEQVTRIYNRTLVAVFKENRKVLKTMVDESNKLFEEARVRKYNVLDTLKNIESSNVNTGHFYVQVVDYISEVTKALVHITRPSFEHIDNNHEGLSKEQIVDLMSVNDDVELMFDRINDMLRSKDFSQIEQILSMRDAIFEKIASAIKNQLRRTNQSNADATTKSSVLYLNILSETKTMVLQARNLVKSQKYFINQGE